MRTAELRHRVPGIYVIENKKTGRKYYGSGQRVGVRRWRHFYDLRAGKHLNPHLQAAWTQDGEDAFEFRVHAYLEKDEIRPTEQRLLDMFYGREDCYNCSGDASAPMTGRKHSKATKELIRSKTTGMKRSAESKARYTAANKKKGISRETLEAAWAANRGRTYTAEHREKIAASRRGKKQKPETVEKRVAKLRGRVMRPEVVEANRQRALKQFADPAARSLASEAATRRWARYRDGVKGESLREAAEASFREWAAKRKRD
jgi:group I intron endonuclease